MKAMNHKRFGWMLIDGGILRFHETSILQIIAMVRNGEIEVIEHTDQYNMDPVVMRKRTLAQCEKCNGVFVAGEVKHFRGLEMCGMCTLGKTNDQLVADAREDYFSRNGLDRIDAPYHHCTSRSVK